MKTHVDWLKFRTKEASPFAIHEALAPAFGALGDLLILGDQEKGKDGWLYRRPLKVVDKLVANVDYGERDDSQRGWSRVDMPGQGCEWVNDWSVMFDAITSLRSSEARRIDIALDFLDGSMTHSRCRAAYDAGLFTASGRKPKAKEVLPVQGNEGRTLYVGRRESPKFFRCYEKGWQIFSQLPESAKTVLKESAQMLVRGQPIGFSDWYRLEVELKAVGDYMPSLDAIRNPDGYFSGACSFFSQLLPSSKPIPAIMKVPDFGARLELEKQIETARVAYGGLIRAMLDLGMSPADVIRDLAAPHPSRRLVDAGCLMLDPMQ